MLVFLHSKHVKQIVRCWPYTCLCRVRWLVRIKTVEACEREQASSRFAAVDSCSRSMAPGGGARRCDVDGTAQSRTPLDTAPKFHMARQVGHQLRNYEDMRIYEGSVHGCIIFVIIIETAFEVACSSASCTVALSARELVDNGCHLPLSAFRCSLSHVYIYFFSDRRFIIIIISSRKQTAHHHRCI